LKGNKLSRRERIKAHFNSLALKRDLWIAKHATFYSRDIDFYKFLIPKGSSVVEVGCGTGTLINALKPSIGLGFDFSKEMISVAGSQNSQVRFCEADVQENNALDSIRNKQTFDYLIMSDTVGYFEDCVIAFENIKCFLKPDSRVIIGYHSPAWELPFKIGEMLGVKMPSLELNWLSEGNLRSMLSACGYEVLAVHRRQLVPYHWLGVGTWFNKLLELVPFVNRLCIRSYMVVRSPVTSELARELSCSIIIPCKNEKGNIENALKRLPKFCEDLEVIFVEGDSSDGTFDEIRRVSGVYSDIDVKYVQQSGKGKGDAVRLGFSRAKGDILMILDADLTVQPEDLPRFYKVLASGTGDFVNGTRMVYPMEEGAMRFLNRIANQIFSIMFTTLLGQTYTDTLCGTKVLTKTNYERIAEGRDYFGKLDPFGDFDLIFGAAKLHLKVIEIPVRYKARAYGETQISRFKHGALLLRMLVMAIKKLKFVG